MWLYIEEYKSKRKYMPTSIGLEIGAMITIRIINCYQNQESRNNSLHTLYLQS